MTTILVEYGVDHKGDGAALSCGQMFTPPEVVTAELGHSFEVPEFVSDHRRPAGWPNTVLVGVALRPLVGRAAPWRALDRIDTFDAAVR
jgi:hypothetical protein